MFLLNVADDILGLIESVSEVSYDDLTALGFRLGSLIDKGAKVAYKVSLDTIWVLSYLGAFLFLLWKELATKKPLTQTCTAELEAPTAPQGSQKKPKAPKAVKNAITESVTGRSELHQEQVPMDNPKGSRRGGRVAKK